MINSRMFPAPPNNTKDNSGEQNNDTSAVFLIDFDGTIAIGHTHYSIVQAISNRHIPDKKESHWHYIRDLVRHHGRHHPTVSAEEWRKVFTTLINDGHKVGIISFSLFPHMIENYIREVVGLPEELAAKVYVYAHLPEDPRSANKNHHIQTALKHFNYHSDDMSRVILIDDSFNNIMGAANLGCTTVMVDEKHSHLEKILSLSAKFKSNMAGVVNHVLKSHA